MLSEILVIELPADGMIALAEQSAAELLRLLVKIRSDWWAPKRD
jgi:hypothetical protein